VQTAGSRKQLYGRASVDFSSCLRFARVNALRAERSNVNIARTEGFPWSAAHGRTMTSLGIASLAFVACVAFALMFFAGDVKGSTNLAWIPFDLTVGTSAVALILSVFSLLARNGKVSTQAMWLYALFLSISIAAMWTEYTPYAVDKIIRLFTFSLIAAMLVAGC